MYLTELQLRSAPGLPRPLTISDLPPGLVLLYGPNASGKSTVGRTLRGSLWPEHAPGGVDARSSWRLSGDGQLHSATLVFGRTGWDGIAPVLAAELALTSHLTLRDLLRPDDTSDRQIARLIQTQLDGGYDLAALAPSVLARVRPLPSVRKPFEAAASSLRDLLNATDALQADEAQLSALQVQATEAAAAPARLELVKKARRRLEAREALAKIEERQSALSPGLDDVPPDAAAVGRGLVEKVRLRAKELDRRQGMLSDAASKVAGLAFPTDPPSEATLALLEERASDLVTDAAAHRRLSEQVVTLEGRVAELSLRVWAEPSTDALPDRAALEALAEVLPDLQAARAREAGLPEPDAAGEPLYDTDQRRLQDARSLLHGWLRAPRPLVATSAPRTNGLLVVALVALGVFGLLVGLALAVFVNPWLVAVAVAGGLLAGVAGGLFVSPWLAPTVAPSSDVDAVERRYREAGHPEVSEWSVSGVQAALDEIERVLREDERARRSAEEARRHEVERSKFRREVERLEQRLGQTVARLGLAPDFPALALLTQADRLRELAEARTALAAARKLEQEASERQASQERSVREALSALGLADLPPLHDAIGLRAAAKAVVRRRQDWSVWVEKAASAAEELENDKSKLGEATKARDDFFAVCGVKPEEVHQLDRLEAEKATWDALAEQARDLRRELGDLDRSLPDDLPNTDPELQAEQERLEDLAATLRAVEKEIAGIHNRVQAATQGRSIQDGIAAREFWLDQLAADRDLHLQAHAEAALALWLRQQRRRDDAPRLLDRARSWFLRFTRNRYELLVDADGVFRALDTHNDLRQSLSELSDGTRVQLLLAARLAFVEHSERGGETTPLFLDEVLSTSDPERFAAVATAVLELAADGRQVFYATADASELHAWNQVASTAGFPAPRVVTLGSASTRDDWAPPPALPGAAPALPALEAHDAISWIAVVGLVRPSLHDGVERWPLALVLHDHLDEAHLAAQAGILHVDQLRLADAGVRLPLSDAALTLASSRSLALRSALDALRIGRGRPVTWEVVAESGAVSSTFEERVQEQLRLHGDDPQAFVEAVAALPRFRSNSAEQLAAHLEEAGVLDPRETLPEEVVVDQACRASREAIRAGVMTVGEVGALVRLAMDVVRLRG